MTKARPRKGGYHVHRGKRFTSVSGDQIGKKARKVYACAKPSCGVVCQPGAGKPAQCIACGGMAFDLFHSTGECGRWNTLKMLERGGKITDLRRQVTYRLMAARRIDGKLTETHVGDYIADFVYKRDGETIVEDFKGSGVMDPLASWKLRHMEAMGVPVKITTS